MTWRLSLPPGRSARIDRLEVRRVVLGADRLEHLDRDDGVVLALDVAVVAQLDVDQVLEAGRADPLAGEVVLLPRDRDGGHPAAELAGGVEGEAAPAGPDLEDVHPGREPGALGDPPVLGPLGVGERLVRRARRPRWSTSSSRPGTGGRSRCPGRSGRRCSCAPAPSCCAAPGARAVRGISSGRRHQPCRSAPGRSVERRELDERLEVGRGPQAVHVRLARAGLAVEEKPRQRPRSWTWISAVPRRRRVAEDAPPAVGHDDGQATDADAGRRADEDPLGGRCERAARDRDARPGAGAGRSSPPVLRARSPPRGPCALVLPRPRPWRWKRTPRRHRRRACQWMSADRLLGGQRMAQQHPQDGPVRQPPPLEDEAGRQQRVRRPGAR